MVIVQLYGSEPPIALSAKRIEGRLTFHRASIRPTNLAYSALTGDGVMEFPQY